MEAVNVIMINPLHRSDKDAMSSIISGRTGKCTWPVLANNNTTELFRYELINYS